MADVNFTVIYIYSTLSSQEEQKDRGGAPTMSRPRHDMWDPALVVVDVNVSVGFKILAYQWPKAGQMSGMAGERNN